MYTRLHLTNKSLAVLILFLLYNAIVYRNCRTRTNLNLNLQLGRWDVQHKYKLFDNILIGDKYVLLNYQYKTCLATQGSIERLYSLIEMSEHWSGPISLATFADSEETLNSLLLYIFYLRNCHKQIKEKVNFHLILAKKKIPQKYSIHLEKLGYLHCGNSTEALKIIRRNFANTSTIFKSKQLYPQNHLRNLARKNCQSDYVFLTDIDIIPCKGMSEDLNTFLAKERCQGKCAYVVAAYELDDKVTFPQNKSVLVKMAKKGLARPFHQKVYSLNQKATDFKRWQNTKDKSTKVQVSHQVNRKFLRFYEPFYIASDVVPQHDERFIGYGYTRNSQVHEMVAAGYKFLVLSPIFICHWGLQNFSSRPRWREIETKMNEQKWRKFVKEISVKYPIKKKKGN
ncbi:unnamed protein product [Psylliodes chrysocephalus]|uniref:Beta-1,4-glucuronyltransferase 1 n=1 Tax=Psylliodes chrysocephalus TaxID=3402493 RepID=A0A9P0D405_9CUCU|nr:unnamed protein product [Psylliodes chrysocephala]